MGLVVFAVMGLYLLVSIGVVKGAIAYAREKGKSAKRWGWGAALVMWLIPFWDWIPTVAMHQYYCATEAGFWVHMTPEQWKKENPGVMETLVNQNSSPKGMPPNWPTEIVRGKEITNMNQRFGLSYTNHLSSTDEKALFINIWRWKTEVIDRKTGSVLAQQIDFSAGNGYVGGEPPLRFWLQSWHCKKYEDSSNQFSELLNQFNGAKK
jgi:hypothetical protein